MYLDVLRPIGKLSIEPISGSEASTDFKMKMFLSDAQYGQLLYFVFCIVLHSLFIVFEFPAHVLAVVGCE